jgi:hypothetical protein
LSAAPASPVKGQKYFNTTTNVEFTYNGTAWVTDMASTQTLAAIAAANPNAGAVAMNNQKITGLAEPTAGSDAATKNYVDTAQAGMNLHEGVTVATTANLAWTYTAGTADASGGTGIGATLTAPAIGITTIDGQNLVLGDRLLVKNQTTALQNGIYAVTTAGTASVATILTRAADFDNSTAGEVYVGDFFYVASGSTLANTAWVMNTVGTSTNPVKGIVLGTDAMSFVQFSGGTSYTAGNGLTLTSGTFAVVGTANRITSTAGSIDIASTYVGQATITTLGTITSGTWNGVAVAVGFGGTGASTAAGARTNLSSSGFALPQKYTATNSSLTPSGNVVAWSIPAATHLLGAITSIIVQVYDTANGALVDTDITVNQSTGDITLQWVSATTVAAGAYRMVAIG